VPGWQGRAHVERALEGGITNRNYVVVVGDDRFVLRRCGRDAHLLEIDRTRELEAATRAADLGLGPAVIRRLPADDVLITRFVEGDAILPAELAHPDVLDVVAAELARFHASGPLSGDFDAFRVPGRHHDVVVARGLAVPAEYERAAACRAEIANAFAAAPEAKVPCHNDLLNANFLRGADRIWLLDWEYAGNNDRYFDLGNMSVNNGFDADAEEALVRAYFGTATRRRLARLRLMRIISDFREAMWGLVQQAISTIDFDYSAYAREHFERLLGAAATPEYRRLLDDAARE
jgi:thiamine kinase-like enzyme